VSERRRSSARITLVLIGSAAMAGCSPSPTDIVSDHYASREECAADWGAPAYCDRVSVAGAGGSGGQVYYRGPTYYAGSRDRLQQQIREAVGQRGLAPSDRAVARATTPAATSRGGFGASARGFSSGG
jgi:uncharacterized protein YgiB involved in biofilm formation